MQIGSLSNLSIPYILEVVTTALPFSLKHLIFAHNGRRDILPDLIKL